jgi:putative ABC transport system ATP-binding protein
MTSLLAIRDLEKSFVAPDGSTLMVIDVPAFDMAHGQQVALRGESGSGKTTFLHLIAGILAADAGSIEFDGADLATMSEPERDHIRARQIGYIFQTFNLLQGYTALENVELAMRFAGNLDRRRAQSLLERVGLKDRMNYRPRQLSVGQQQRVAVARALANQPRLVLADEPTGNLDFRRGGESLALIREVCTEQQAALLLVSHDRQVLDAFATVRDLRELNRAMGELVAEAL